MSSFRPMPSAAGARSRIAFFAPLSPMRGGVVDYSEDLLPYLAEYFDIDVYTHDGLEPSNPSIRSIFPVYGHSQFLQHDRRARYTEVIYQIGCSADHVPDYEALMKRPGVSVLHELNLSGILGAKTLARRRRLAYFWELYRTEGARVSVKVAARFLRTKKFPGYADFYMNRVALRRSRALIVHNGFMERELRRTLTARNLNTPIHRVPLAVPEPPSFDPSCLPGIRRQLGLPSDAYIVGSFGIVHESKRLSVALNAFGRLLRDVPNAQYLLVGPPHSSLEVDQVKMRGFGDRVRLTGHIDMRDFYRYMAVTDLCLNLRYPSTGGTSNAQIRLMSAGKPVVVTNIAQFAELPDDACLKVNVGSGEEDALYQRMLWGARDQVGLARIGARARQYVEANHTLARAALAYKNAILTHSAGADTAID